MKTLHPYHVAALLLVPFCGALLLAGCSGGDEARTILAEPATSSSVGTASSLPPTSPGNRAGVVEPSSSTTTSPTTTVVAPSTSGATPPSTAGPTEEPSTDDNLYALAGARAIAAKANENDLSGLDPDVVAEVLLEASEAAYEIEYPSVVMYLDVSQDDDRNLVVVTEDESQTIVGTAYVCVVDGTAVAQEDACDPTSSN